MNSKEYRSFIEDIKSKIRAAQVKASFSVNAELIRLYWDIGCSVVDRQMKGGWGSSVVDQMSLDIHKEFPGIDGFSPSNISRMRAFYLAWKDMSAISAQAVPKLPGLLFHIPWGHHVVLLFKIKDSGKRIWYAQKIMEHGWSRPALVQSNRRGCLFASTGVSLDRRHI